MTRIKSKIPFVNLHGSHTTFSLFDGLGFPEDHMRFAWENGLDAMAITDHGNMNAMVYQLEAQKKLADEGKEVKNIFGCEMYFHSSIAEWKQEYDEHREKQKKKKTEDDASIEVEDDAEAKKQIKNSLKRRSHLLLLATNQVGLNNLFKLVSMSFNGDNFYRFPRIDFEMLEKYNEGLIVSQACLGGFLARYMWENFDKTDEEVLDIMREPTKRMMKIFGDRWYGELQWNSIPEQHRLNQLQITLSKELGFQLISTADAHYPSLEMWRDREVYKKLGWLGKKASETPEWAKKDVSDEEIELEYELYQKNGDQMWEAYKKYSAKCGVTYDDQLVLDSIERTRDIAHNRIETFAPDNTVRLPNFVVPEGKDADGYLAELAVAGLKTFGLTKEKEYVARLKNELYVIRDRGFSKYFLTMKEIVDEAKMIGLTGAARGSAAGSLTAYVLGITQVDPIKWGLLFERFLLRDATDYPDIDVDVGSPMELKEHLINKWGSDTVVPVSNFNTLQLRSLIKDISKLYEVDWADVNPVTSKMMWEATPLAKKKHGITAGVYVPTFEEVKEFSPSLQKFFRKYPKIKQHVNNLHGQIRSSSRHAGGVCVGENLDYHMPLIKSGGVTQTPWTEGVSGRYLENRGMIKFDLLGLSTLRMIEECIRKILMRHENVSNPSIKDVWKYYNKHLHPDVINFDDKSVWENIFHKGKFIGVFQMTERGAQGFCKQALPSSIPELSNVTAIYRPATLSANVDKTYLSVLEDPDSIVYEHPMLKEILGSRYGLMIYQEDIATIAHKFGKNISLDDGNKLRKLLIKTGLSGSPKKQLDVLNKKFIDGCQEKGLSKPLAVELWKKMEYFSGYGFNLSHSTSYSILSYQCAWLLNYYPSEYAAAFLDKEPESRKEKAINLVKAAGFKIQPCDINDSDCKWKIHPNDDKVLIQPLTSLKGLGEKAIEQIINNRPFNSIEDLLLNKEVVYSKLNKKAFDVLIRSESLKGLMDSRFNHLRHLWLTLCDGHVPKTQRDIDKNIGLHANEVDFLEEERIEDLAALTGIFPIDMILTDQLQRELDEKYVLPISEWDSNLGNVLWGIPREVIKKKTKTNKDYYVVNCIDRNSVSTMVRCWGVNPAKDKIHINRPYMMRLNYDANWGWSCRGPTWRNWKMLG